MICVEQFALPQRFRAGVGCRKRLRQPWRTGMNMGVYLVFATRNLRAAVCSTCTSYYIPFDHLAVVSYEGSAEELARRLDLHRTGGPGTRVRALSARRACRLAAGLAVALLSVMLT
jgi:hypothetical protein